MNLGVLPLAWTPDLMPVVVVGVVMMLGGGITYLLATRGDRRYPPVRDLVRLFRRAPASPWLWLLLYFALPLSWLSGFLWRQR